MSARARQREARRAALRLQCAPQREQLAHSLAAVQHHLEPVDKTLTTLSGLLRRPLLAGALAALAAVTTLSLAGRARRPRIGSLSWLLPLAAPTLRLLEAWWQRRRSGPPGQALSETHHPHHP